MNQDPAQEFAGRLYVGTIYVDVGYDMDVPAATTDDSIFGALDLGGTVSVDLPQYLFGDEERGEDDPPMGSTQMWMILLARMRNMLASCWLLGQMKPQVMGSRLTNQLRPEERENLGRAIELLGEEFFEISPEVAFAAVAARHEQDRQFQDGLHAVFEFIVLYQEPGENITIEEALRRAEKQRREE
jgi:hypothetical protein